MLDTAAVPTVVPPLLQSLGGEDCGPNTLKVIVPPAPLVAPDRMPLIDPAAVTVPAVPLAGADTLALVASLTTVEVMPVPQPLLDGWFAPSSPL